MPTLRHNPTAQIVELRGKTFMIDCGEGTQTALRRSRVRFGEVSRVFISHIHGDHCLGLIGLISTFGMLGRTNTLHIHAPANFEDILRRQIAVFAPRLDFAVEFHATDTTEAKVIYEDKSLTVESVPLRHRVECAGFLFREKPTLPHLRRDIFDMYGIPFCEVNNIKAGKDWTTAEGELVPNCRLVTPADPPRAYAFCSDTAYIPDLHRQLKGVDLLYHEATYAADHTKAAERYCHSTTLQAAQVALDAGVGRLIIGHYSARCDDENLLLDEAKSVFPRTELAEEGKIFTL